MKHAALVKYRSVFTKFPLIWWVYVAIVIISGIHLYLLGFKYFQGTIQYTHYNNYVIFKQSFFHLIHNQDLYILYPQEQWDLYKYSPTFALLMGTLAYLPDLLGLILWNALNALLLFFAIRTLPFVMDRDKAFILWFILLETLTSIQNAQSNALMAALIILAFTQFEKKNVAWAALCLVLGCYIKIFALVAASLFLFYPSKLKFIGYSVLWGTFLLVLPLLVVSPAQLQFLYESWLRLLSEDHTASYGLSVMGWLYTWFGWELPKNLVVLAGVVLFCLPYTRFRHFQYPIFRLLFLASVLLWIVLFNHKAESPTFVIAMCGVGIWYFVQPRTNSNTLLVVLAFIFTSLSPTDIFPRYLREHLVNPYVLKAVFCIFIWFKLIYQFLAVSYFPKVAPTYPTAEA